MIRAQRNQFSGLSVVAFHLLDVFIIETLRSSSAAVASALVAGTATEKLCNGTREGTPCPDDKSIRNSK